MNALHVQCRFWGGTISAALYVPFLDGAFTYADDPEHIQEYSKQVFKNAVNASQIREKLVSWYQNHMEVCPRRCPRSRWGLLHTQPTSCPRTHSHQSFRASLILQCILNTSRTNLNGPPIQTMPCATVRLPLQPPMYVVGLLIFVLFFCVHLRFPFEFSIIDSSIMPHASSSPHLAPPHPRRCCCLIVILYRAPCNGVCHWCRIIKHISMCSVCWGMAVKWLS